MGLCLYFEINTHLNLHNMHSQEESTKKRSYIALICLSTQCVAFDSASPYGADMAIKYKRRVLNASTKSDNKVTSVISRDAM